MYSEWFTHISGHPSAGQVQDGKVRQSDQC